MFHSLIFGSNNFQSTTDVLEAISSNTNLSPLASDVLNKPELFSRTTEITQATPQEVTECDSSPPDAIDLDIAAMSLNDINFDNIDPSVSSQTFAFFITKLDASLS